MMGSFTRYDISTNSYIDYLVIVSPNLANKTKWEVLSNNFDSDHFLISVDVAMPMSNNDTYVLANSCAPKWAFNKADWVLYKELTGNINENVDYYYQNLIQFINQMR